MLKIRHMTERYGVDLLFGYIESAGDALYSSCAVIERGEVIYNYRRISTGWKEPSEADRHYREGRRADGFYYRGRHFALALCGDLWDCPEWFKTDDVLIWPVYVDFSAEEWAEYLPEYARRAQKAARRTLMVNSLSQNPDSVGGAFYFADGEVKQRSPFGEQRIMAVEL